jgi:hypothetical protein
MEESFALISAIQEATILHIRDIALDIAKELIHCQRSLPINDDHEALEHWSLSATNLTIDCNRDTPFHLQEDAGAMSYSVFASFGQYIESKFKVKGLDFHCYDIPGTVMVGMTGLFPYGVSRGDGNRINFTLFTPRQTLIDTATFTKNDRSLEFLCSSPLPVSTFDSAYGYIV